MEKVHLKLSWLTGKETKGGKDEKKERRRSFYCWPPKTKTYKGFEIFDGLKTCTRWK